jgi:hypothetical protein
MNRVFIATALGVIVLAFASANSQAGTFARPAFTKVIADLVQTKPRLAQAGKPDAGPGSSASPRGSGDASRGSRSGRDSSRSSRGGGDSRAHRGGGDDRRWRGPRPDGYGWRGPGPRYVGPPRHYYRPWSRRPYYGSIFGGIVLGTIIGVAIVGVVPPSPDPDLCWYWADPYRSRGYWDYCD